MKKKVSKAREISFYAGYLAQKGLIVGSEGNLSLRDTYGLWITPSAKIKELLSPEEVCFVDWEGNFVKGKPSSEWGMHYFTYFEVKDAGAIVHAHPEFVILLAEAGFDFRKFFLKEAEILLKKVEVVDFFPPGSRELWQHVKEAARKTQVIVLKGHGAVTWGKDLEEAVNLMLVLEKLCKLEFTKIKRGGS